MNDATSTAAKHSVNRRKWMAEVAGAAAALACGGVAMAGETIADRPWIDAHSHIWTRDVERFPLAAGMSVDDLQPASFTAEELLDVAGRHGVGRVVLIQHHPYHGWDNSYVLDAARRYPDTFRVVGMVDNFAAEPGRQMERLLAANVSGFRITSGIYQQRWLGGGMDEMWRTAAKTGQNICCLINPAELPEIDHMCARHPGTSVVIDHFARIGIDGQIREQDLDALTRLARHARTYLKISAFYALGQKQPPYTDLVPMIRRVLDAFGVERLMWASDSPYQLEGQHSYTASLDLVRQHLDFLSDGDRQWLLRKTADQVFFTRPK
jgi:predicted TIM-barrel fold metal-dependent hydrolase